MKIEKDMTHDAPPEAVFAVMTNPEFVTERCQASGALNFTQQIDTSGANTVVTTDRAMPPDGLPDLLKNFAKSGIKIRDTTDWGPAEADGSRTAQISLDFLGQPMKMRGSMRLTPAAGGSLLSVRADLKASIPLLGGKIEGMTAPLIIAAIEQEEALGKEWLSR